MSKPLACDRGGFFGVGLGVHAGAAANGEGAKRLSREQASGLRPRRFFVLGSRLIYAPVWVLV